eukprot:COSAG05_NODE_5714_length_1109_cov_1.467327_1_plen_72_part_00
MYLQSINLMYAFIDHVCRGLGHSDSDWGLPELPSRGRRGERPRDYIKMVRVVFLDAGTVSEVHPPPFFFPD